jgi:RNA polymerase sigma-70 factor (ECF subfamily)
VTSDDAVTSDDDVVARAKQGDAEAWRALYRDHAGRLLVWLRTRPSHDAAVAAEDLAAEAWLVAADKVSTFQGTSEEFAGWLFGIARKLGGNVRRRALRRNTQPDGLSTLTHHPVMAGPEPAYAAHDWVTRALAILPPRERDVVGCREVVGLDVEATSAALGISPVAVRVAHHRGLRRLRETTPTPDQVGSSVRSPAR